MTLKRIGTAADIINRAAVEVGLAPQIDPYSSADDSFLQLTNLLNTAGDELVSAYPWEFLIESHQQTTFDTDSGNYPLPDDFLYMIPQTGWEHSNRVPLFGPLSPQDWTYLEGRRLATRTIYASFRLRDGVFSIFPQPPPSNLDINFEYVSKNWVLDGTDSTTRKDLATQAGDIILYDRILMSHMLKMKYLEAKGLDSTKASDDFNQAFAMITGVDKSAEILNAGGRGRGFPYLDTYRNTPDTNYGGGFI